MLSKLMFSTDEFIDFEVILNSPSESHRSVVHCFDAALDYATHHFGFLYERLIRGEQCSLKITPVLKPKDLFTI